MSMNAIQSHLHMLAVMEEKAILKTPSGPATSPSRARTPTTSRSQTSRNRKRRTSSFAILPTTAPSSSAALELAHSRVWAGCTAIVA